MKLKFIEGIIKIVRSIPAQKYNQKKLFNFEEEEEGCMAYHYDKTYGKGCLFQDLEDVGFDKTEISYLTDYPWHIPTSASKLGWPVFGESINKTNALQRLNFIKSQIKKQS